MSVKGRIRMLKPLALALALSAAALSAAALPRQKARL